MALVTVLCTYLECISSSNFHQFQYKFFGYGSKRNIPPTELAKEVL
jgi:hypothetical protein